MPQKTMTAGGILVFLGLAGYLASSFESLTAMIPAAIGAILIGLGAGARKESLRKHLIHGAAVVALLGIVGTVPGVIKLVGLVFGGSVERPLAVASQTITALVCGWFLVAAVGSFIVARKTKA